MVISTLNWLLEGVWGNQYFDFYSLFGYPVDMRQKLLLFSLLILILLACELPAELNQPLGGKTPKPPQVDVTAVPKPTQTPTLQPTPTLVPIDYDQLVGNGLDDYQSMTEDELLAAYYAPSPDLFIGYATKYGSDPEFPVRVMWRHMQEMQEQFDHAGFSYVGGGAGFVEFAGRGRFLLDDRRSAAWAIIVEDKVFPTGVGGTELDRRGQNTLRMYAENSGGDYSAFLKLIRRDFVGVVAMKSQNDLGRVFCLINGRVPHQPIGRVIVGDMARRIDWLPNDVDHDQYQLGFRIYIDEHGKEWQWAVELPNELYDQIVEDWAALAILAPPEYCPTRPKVAPISMRGSSHVYYY